MTNEKTHATTTTTPSDQPPAYSSPVIHPQQDTPTTTATTTTSTALNVGNSSDGANAPPPSYKPKRTPSQEEIYIRELKAWAAEKSTMYPGAYGEDYGRVVAPLRQREQAYTGREQSRGGGGAQSLISRGLREQQQRGTDVDESVEIAHAGTPPAPKPSSSWRRKDSGSGLSTSHNGGAGAGWSSSEGPTSSSFSGGATSPGSHPGPSSFKRRMSNFMQKMKRQDDSSVVGSDGRETAAVLTGRDEDRTEGGLDGVARA